MTDPYSFQLELQAAVDASSPFRLVPVTDRMALELYSVSIEVELEPRWVDVLVVRFNADPSERGKAQKWILSWREG